MRSRLVLVITVTLGGLLGGCSSHGRATGPGTGDDAGVPVGTLVVDPSDVTLDLAGAGGTSSATFTVKLHGQNGDEDVTSQAMYTLTDASIGTMSQNTFNAGTDHGGSTTLLVSYNSATGQASIHVKVHGVYAPSCPGCPPFPPDSAPRCGAGGAATVVYPPDGVLLPPNMGQLEVQFKAAAGATLYEIDFENPATDVRIETECKPTVDTNLLPSGGCFLDLDRSVWDLIARSNKGGDPVQVSVRASTDGTCANPSPAVGMAFAQQDVTGGIYYWKSVLNATSTGVGGAIWRKSFGDDLPAEAITATNGMGFGATCYGCHFLSRDGKRMTVNADDNDSDDEYDDVSSGLVDVASKLFLSQIGYSCGQAPGFQTFSNDHVVYLGTNGDGGGQNGKSGGVGMCNFTPTVTSAPSNSLFEWNGVTGQPLGTPSITVGPAGSRPTQPDWSADDKNVVFVIPAQVGTPSWQKNDTHIFGGSLWTMPYLGAGTFGAATEIIHSKGENNYYPSYSPDSSFIIFNRVPPSPISNCSASGCPNDSFANPKARVFLLPTMPGAQPIDCEALNGSKKSATVDASNSWPRWSPFIQTYRGSKLLWVTFSSTRDYGLRVRNHGSVGGMPQVQCYPPDTPENLPGGDHSGSFAPNCQQPQIWMAAINLTSAEVANPTDPSFPAFWLPFQDIATHNHTAQWTTTIAPSPPDGGVCIPTGQDCTKDPNNCCTGTCSATGTCSIG